jgi:hypothetical protein
MSIVGNTKFAPMDWQNPPSQCFTISMLITWVL